MGLHDRLFPSSSPKTKGLNSGIFTYLTGAAAPDIKGGEFLGAYTGWVNACVNAIAEVDPTCGVSQSI